MSNEAATINPEELSRMEELNTILTRASHAYYNEDREIMSNYEYDALNDELVSLEEKTGFVLPNSITQGAGVEAVSELAKIEHETPMLSLGKTKSRDEILKWVGDKKVCLSWKLDGSTVVLTYENGKIVQGVTRGNGLIGEDITAQAKKFAFVPQSIDFTGKLVVRGEALMTYTEFERVNAMQPDVAKYKNPRNLASGTMRALDTSLLDERTVEFHPFTLVSAEGYENNSYAGRLDWLNSLGFSSVEHYPVDASNIIDKIDELEGTIDEQDIPSDGLVIFFDDVAYGDSLGSTGHAPRNGIAFKWADETAQTTLKEIFWSASRTGRLNPVAVFEPVELEGTTVERATLNNLTFINELMGVPYEGQVLTVYKANKIIPTVVDAVPGDKNTPGALVPPEKCPVCGQSVEHRTDHDSEFLYCVNDECPAKTKGVFDHFASRDAMNIMGLSGKKLEKLMEAGIIASFADILNIKDKKDEIISKEEDPTSGKTITIYHVESFKERTVENLVDAVEKAKNTTASRFLYALGIREIGRTASRDICKAYGNNVEAIIEDAANGRTEKFQQVEGIGEIMISELTEYMAKNKDMVEKLLSLVNITDAGSVVEANDNDFISGNVFVVTGAVHNFANRDELKAFVLDNGGKVAGSVSKNTDFLITNTPDSGTSKNKKAQQLGVAIITEDEFCERAGL